jgi:hypothetical protein
MHQHPSGGRGNDAPGSGGDQGGGSGQGGQQ